MSDTPTLPPHPFIVRILHWCSVALVVVAFGLGLALDLWPRGPARDTPMMVHASLGMQVVALAALRLLHRLVARPAASNPAESRLALLAASAMHWALYAAIVLLPITGMLARWGAGGR